MNPETDSLETSPSNASLTEWTFSDCRKRQTLILIIKSAELQSWKQISTGKITILLYNYTTMYMHRINNCINFKSFVSFLKKHVYTGIIYSFIAYSARMIALVNYVNLSILKIPVLLNIPLKIQMNLWRYGWIFGILNCNSDVTYLFTGNTFLFNKTSISKFSLFQSTYKLFI